MASTQKRTSSSGGSGSRSRSSASSTSRSGGRRASSQSKTQGKRSSSRRSAPAKKPYRRELGGAVCLLLALFGAIGYFKTEDGAVIALFCNLLKGLVGCGFYIAPPMLLAAAGVLLFHRGRPVRLRVTGTLALPVLAGALLHLLLCRTEYEWGWTLFGQLWTDGRAVSCGGAVSGTLAMAFRFAFTTVGAVVILLLLTAAAALCALRLTPADILDYLRERKANQPQYDPDDYPEEPPRRPKREPEPVPAPRRGKSPAIDIPVDDGPLLAKKPTTPVTTVRPKSFFDKVAGVAAPGQKDKPQPVMEEEPPEYMDVTELHPMQEPPRTPKPGPAAPPPAASDLLSPPAPTPIREEPGASVVHPSPVVQDDPVPPPVIREPAAPSKPPKEDPAQLQQALAQEIEAGMSQDNPPYRYPPLSLLNQDMGGSTAAADSEQYANQQLLQDALQSFGVSASIANVVRGPSVTRYELALDQGVKLSKITNLSGDIALSLGVSGVIVAPIPGKISTVGIEVPNRVRSNVSIRDVLESDEFRTSSAKSKVSFAVGKDISGRAVVGNIAKLPHMLIAGTTGSGKSVCTNSIITSILYEAKPEEVRFIMVDPKMVEFAPYNGIPHLLIPVVTDPKKAAGALQWAVSEMLKRYQKFSETGTKDLASYNVRAKKQEDLEPMPQIVIIIDELADLMMAAAKEVEESICRVAQMGRAAGMHLIIATQSPRADVITGLIKANIPSRIALRVSDSLESRIILGTVGAEKLMDKGDMLYVPVGQEKLRVQGCNITPEETANLVDFIKQDASAQYDEQVMHEVEKNAEEKEKAAKGVGGPDPAGGDYDELLPAAIDIVMESGQASVSMLQRRLKIGYGRGARLVDQMEELGVVGPFEGSKPRQLLITKEQYAEMKYKRGWVDAVPGGMPQIPISSEDEAVPEELPFEGDAVPQSWSSPPFDE